jgi:hypothetical protein
MDFAIKKIRNVAKKTYKKHFCSGGFSSKTAKVGGGSFRINNNVSIPSSLHPYLKRGFKHKDFQIANLCFLFEHSILQHFWDYLSFSQKKHFLKRNDVGDFFDHLLQKMQKKIVPVDNDDLPKHFEVGKMAVVPEFFHYFFYLDEPFDE